MTTTPESWGPKAAHDYWERCQERDRKAAENQARMERQALEDFARYVEIVTEGIEHLIPTERLDDLHAIAEAAVLALIDDGLVFARLGPCDETEEPT